MTESPRVERVHARVPLGTQKIILDDGSMWLREVLDARDFPPVHVVEPVPTAPTRPPTSWSVLVLANTIEIYKDDWLCYEFVTRGISRVVELADDVSPHTVLTVSTYRLPGMRVVSDEPSSTGILFSDDGAVEARANWNVDDEQWLVRKTYPPTMEAEDLGLSA